MTRSSHLKKPLLYGLIGSVLFGAVLAIIFVVRNTWSWFEVQVILTTIVIASGSLCGLACDLSRRPRGMNLLPKTGLMFTGLCIALLLAAIWLEIGSEPFWRCTICLLILGIATVHVCLLSIAHLAKRFQWIYFIGVQVIFGFALLLCAVTFELIDIDDVSRLIAATSIIIAAFSLTIPILHRISKMGPSGADILTPLEERNLVAIDDEIRRMQQRLDELKKIRASLGNVALEPSGKDAPPEETVAD